MNTVARKATRVGMTVYQALYNPGTAALIITLSWIALAASQARVVFDGLAFVHDEWGVGFTGVAAFGYEVATLGTGLALAVIGAHRGARKVKTWPIWAALIFFLVVSSWFGLDSALRSGQGDNYTLGAVLDIDGIALLRAVLAGAALPLQYILAVMAGHKLAQAAGDDDEPDERPHMFFASLARPVERAEPGVHVGDDGVRTTARPPTAVNELPQAKQRARPAAPAVRADPESTQRALTAMRSVVAKRQGAGEDPPSLRELAAIARRAAGGGWASPMTVARNLERAGLARDAAGRIVLAD